MTKIGRLPFYNVPRECFKSNTSLEKVKRINRVLHGVGELENESKHLGKSYYVLNIMIF